MKIQLAKHYGFCSGVKNAISIANKAIKENQNRHIFLVGKLVHNQAVNDYFIKQGVSILNSFDEINSLNKGDVIIFTAHGHAQKYHDLATSKGLIIYDTTCPRVIANLNKIKTALKDHQTVIYIGLPNHPESDAALSLSSEIIFINYLNPIYPRIALKNPYVFNQTTLSRGELKNIYQQISFSCQNPVFIDDICKATEMRQQAFLDLDSDVDLIVVIGDSISSNCQRLVEVARNNHPNVKTLLVGNIATLKQKNIIPTKKVFITASASTPDSLIEPIIEYFENL